MGITKRSVRIIGEEAKVSYARMRDQNRSVMSCCEPVHQKLLVAESLKLAASWNRG